MAFTQNQLTALESAIGTGELSIEYDGKKVAYRSMGDLMKAYDFVKGQLQAAGTISCVPMSNRGPASLTVFSRD
jgi:hypothetical protein